MKSLGGFGITAETFKGVVQLSGFVNSKADINKRSRSPAGRGRDVRQERHAAEVTEGDCDADPWGLGSGSDSGAAVVWLWGREVEEYVQERTRAVRMKAAEGVRAVTYALRAGQEAIRPAPAAGKP